MFSRCFLNFSVGVVAFVIERSLNPSFFTCGKLKGTKYWHLFATCSSHHMKLRAGFLNSAAIDRENLKYILVISIWSTCSSSHIKWINEFQNSTKNQTKCNLHYLNGTFSSILVNMTRCVCRPSCLAAMAVALQWLDCKPPHVITWRQFLLTASANRNSSFLTWSKMQIYVLYTITAPSAKLLE